MSSTELTAGEEKWLDIDGYAAVLGISRWALRDMVTARRVHHHRVGKHVRFSPEDRAANAAMWTERPLKESNVIEIRARRGTGRRRSA